MGSIKELLQYLFNAVKFWIIVQPWEQGLRVRFGRFVKQLKGGLYFRIPYIDSLYIQSVQLRVIQLPMQTLTSKDLKTITINGVIGYSICDVEKLYKTLYHPEFTLSNLAMSELAEFIYHNCLADIKPKAIEMAVSKKLHAGDYGIKIKYFRLTSFAVVRTYRLIQDQSWCAEGMTLNEKR